MRAATADDLERMRSGVFFEPPDMPQKLSRFWVLLVLAATIASAGVVGGSTATVIGAMIMAPLMTPILGTMLAVVLGDRRNLMWSVALVAGGAAAAIVVGFVIGLGVQNPITAATNSQVADRVNPRLIDLIAALATGVVGSVALVRRDISDTLPGVAIAISLVPPLTVVGLTAEAGHYSEAAGALLLFATNVAAILGTGVVVMALYQVHRLAHTAAQSAEQHISRRGGQLVVLAFLVIVAVPLVGTTRKIAADTARESTVLRASTAWAESVGWDVVQVRSDDQGTNVIFAGPPPIPSVDDLTAALRSAGVTGEVTAEFVPTQTVSLDGG